MKSMNLKRFGAAVMGGVMALSMAVPAFASANVEITGTFEEMEIAVVVTDSGEAQINPYGLPVKITKSDKTTVEISDEQITSSVLSLRNQSTTPLDVNVSSFAVKPTGGMEIINAALAPATNKGKQVHVDLEVAPLNDSTLAVLTTEKIDDKLIDKFAADATWSGLAAANKLAAPNATAATAATVTGAKSTAALATLGAATVNSDNKTVYGAKSIALFRLKGTLNSDPVKTESGNDVDDPWASTDGFTATIAFTFKPAAKTTVTVTATGTTTVAPPSTVKGYEGQTITVPFEAATGKTCTGTVTGMSGTAPTVTVTEAPSGSGKYTASFTMPADDTTPGIALTITIPS